LPDESHKARKQRYGHSRNHVDHLLKTEN
jgi:hypothetical protein